MQAWDHPRAQCFYCSLRKYARWTLGPSGNRHRTAVSNFSQGRARDRTAKGGLKGSALTPARRKEADDGAIQQSGLYPRIRMIKSSPFQKVLRTQESGKVAVELELQRLRHTLKEGKTPDGAEPGYVELDPELQYFDPFEARVRRCFDEKVPSDTANALKASLTEAFLQDGRSGLRKELLFAYIDHIIASRREVCKTPSVPKHLDLRYPTEWYLGARAMQREIHLHVGPTNSGKTYHALKRLEEAGDGLYAGPLRLLAHEVYTRFKSKGTPCDLVTGDDVRRVEGQEARLSSHTVEMVDCSRAMDVAVIDEIQMIAQEERGWAWTRALLGIQAKELHLCGEARVIPLIRELAATMGDTLHIHHYDRLNPLKAVHKSLKGDFRGLRRGDCIVSFSVLGIHAMKKQIELETGRRVAIVYGSLPPEIRAQQAALFNDPYNDYDFLVASDAIGMGLNLSIKRIIFETIWKHDGERRVKLSVSQIKQIAGRAGRYRTAIEAQASGGTQATQIDLEAEGSRSLSFQGTVKQRHVGLVTCLEERDLHDINIALDSEPDPIKAAGVMPPVEHIDAFANGLPPGTPFEYLLQRLAKQALLHPRFFLCRIKEQNIIARVLDQIKGLSVVQNCVFSAAPADVRTDTGKRVLVALARCVANRTAVTVVDIPDIPLDVLDQPLSGDREYLLNLELLHKSLIVYLWLSYRFTNIFLDREMAIHAKEMVEDKINTTLLDFSANPKLREKLGLLREAEQAADISNRSPAPSEKENQVDRSQRLGQSVQEAGLARSLNDPSALPIDWDDTPSRGEMNPNAAAISVGKSGFMSGPLVRSTPSS